jgi:transcriptional regulator with XRE-family HTH domain
MSQRKLAEAMARDVTQVNGWECGRSEPSEVSIVRIAEALGITPEELRDGPVGGEIGSSQQPAEDWLSTLARRLGVEKGRLKVTIEING